MKKKNRIALVILIVVILFFAAATMHTSHNMRHKDAAQEFTSQKIDSSGTQENKEESEKSPKYIIRAWYEGEKPGEEKHKYYAADGDGGFIQITQEELPEEIRENSEDVEIFDAKDSNVWYMELGQFEDLDRVEKSVWKETDLGENIFITWYNWTENTEDAGDEAIEFFEDAAGSFRKMDPEAIRWKKKNETGLVSFMVIENNGDYLVKNDIGDVLYKMDDAKGLVEIIRSADGGVFDYCWFL